MVNIFLFFFFLFQTLRFFRKSARVSSVFRTFPNLQNLIKAFKNTSKLQFSTSILGLLVHNPIKHNIHTYTFVYFKSSKHSNLLQFHAHFYKKNLGLSRAYADRLRTSSTEDQSPRSSFSNYIHIYIYT